MQNYSCVVSSVNILDAKLCEHGSNSQRRIQKYRGSRNLPVVQDIPVESICFFAAMVFLSTAMVFLSLSASSNVEKIFTSKDALACCTQRTFIDGFINV
jgi:hypothetical protein